MSTWPTSPVWNDPTLINSGNMYESADGVTASDFNAIIENLMYLVQTDRIIEANSLPTTDIDTKALYFYEGSYYRYTESGNWLRYLIPAGTLNINANGTYSIVEYSSIVVNVKSDSVPEWDGSYTLIGEGV